MSVNEKLVDSLIFSCMVLSLQGGHSTTVPVPDGAGAGPDRLASGCSGVPGPLPGSLLPEGGLPAGLCQPQGGPCLAPTGTDRKSVV